MAIFEWLCRDCMIYWDRDCPVGKAPKKTKCPKCTKLSGKYYQNSGMAISFKDDGCGNKGTGAGDFHTVKQRYRKHNKMGFDKDSANRFLHRSIAETKERKDNAPFYKSANFNWEKMEEDGLVHKLSETDRRAKVERARELTINAYDKATKMGYKDINQDKLDIAKPQKQG